MFHIDEFLEALRDRRYSQKTIGAYRSLIIHLKEYLEKYGVSEIKSSSDRQIQKYAGRLEEKNPASKHGYVQILRLKKYLAFLEQRDFLFLSPLREYPSPKFHMQARHCDWTDRQLYCCLYWQPKAHKQLRSKVESFLNSHPHCTVLYRPEAYGVDVTATMASIGIYLEWPPRTAAYQTALMGVPKKPNLYARIPIARS